MTKPSYQTHAPKGWCGDPWRGAAVGRPSIHCTGFTGKLYVQRVWLDTGGYDKNGTYFGIGGPLYWIASADTSVDYVERAETREQAVLHALQIYPRAKIRGVAVPGGVS